MKEFTDYVQGMLKKLLAFTFLIAGALGFCGYSHLLTGWLAGSVLNLVYFIMLSNRSARAVTVAPEKMVRFIRFGSLLRLVVIALALIVVLQFPSINFWAVVAGLFSFRVLIYLEPLLTHITKHKEEGR